jgi:hypothetical protein
MSIESFIKKHKAASSTLKFGVITLNAAQAQELHDQFNHGNRPFSRSLAGLYANEQLRGKWDEENGEALVFGNELCVGDDGVEFTREVLISGQHRLRSMPIAAAIAANDPDNWPSYQQTITFPVIYGADASKADTVDTGKSRNHQDVLYRSPLVDDLISEVDNASQAARKRWCGTLSSAARLVWLRQGGATVSSASKFGITEMLEFITNQHRGLAGVVSTILEINRADAGNKGLRASLGYIAALTYLACLDVEGNWDAEAETRILEAWRAVATGANLVPQSPEHALVGFWNKLYATPGSKNRDLDIVGPIIKFLRLVIEQKTGVKAVAIGLSAKEQKNYKKFPPLLDGWDTASFEEAAAAREAAGDTTPDDETPAEDDEATAE